MTNFYSFRTAFAVVPFLSFPSERNSETRRKDVCVFAIRPYVHSTMEYMFPRVFVLSRIFARQTLHGFQVESRRERERQRKLAVSSTGQVLRLQPAFREHAAKNREIPMKNSKDKWASKKEIKIKKKAKILLIPRVALGSSGPMMTRPIHSFASPHSQISYATRVRPRNTNS